MKIEIADPYVGRIAALLAGEGYQARLVGGAVRDIVSGRAPRDMDMSTDALPAHVVAIAESAGLRVIPTGLQHGTVTVVVEGLPYEVTTLRRDVETDGRHATVEYVSDFREDAARRDFTINAMSASMDGLVHDYFGGIADLAARRIRFVGNADERIAEDYLRILRFFRFRARYGGSEDNGDLDAVARAMHGLASISVERVWMEMSRIIVHPRGCEQIETMQRLGILDVIGLEFDRKRLSVASAAASAGARPGTVIGILCGTATAAADLAARWRLSSVEAEDASVAARVLSDTSDDPLHWLGVATDGIDPSRIVPVLEATGRPHASDVLRRPLPVFPLRGRDLAEAGVERGRGMGEALKRARAEWKASGFTANRNDLLQQVIHLPRRP